MTTKTAPAGPPPPAGVVFQKGFAPFHQAKAISSKPTSSPAMANTVDLHLLPRIDQQNDTRRTSSPGGCCFFKGENPFVSNGLAFLPRRTKRVLWGQNRCPVVKSPTEVLQMFRRHKPWADRSGIGEQRVSLRHD
ncbi:MAG: hypothetical protein E5W91_23755, partial [Mesorhizobium sp.]